MPNKKTVFLSFFLFLILAFPAGLLNNRTDQNTTSKLTKFGNNVQFKGWSTSSKATVGVTPDTSFSILKDAISKANNSIYIEIYQFWSMDIFSLINSTLRSKPNIILKVLIENDTGTRGSVNNPDRFNMYYAYLFYSLGAEGFNVEVRLETSYDYYHGKLIIIDEKMAFVSSDNFVPTSFPRDPSNIQRPKYNSYYYYSKPSRGWVALVNGIEAVSFYVRVFNNDFSNAVPYDPNIYGIGVDFDGYSSYTYTPIADAIATSYDVSVKPVVSPYDSWGNITDLLYRANHTILLELLYIYNSAWDLVNVLEEVHKNKGVTVMIIVEDDSPGNYNEIASKLEKLGFHVVPAFNNDEILFLHNKGIIVDDRLVFVGSINWSGGAFNNNREFGVILDSRDLASTLRKVYGFDWDKSRGKRDYPFDSDGDGLPDYYEEEHGLDRLNPDTDGDGVSDYDEVYIFGTAGGTGNSSGSGHGKGNGGGKKPKALSIATLSNSHEFIKNLRLLEKIGIAKTYI